MDKLITKWVDELYEQELDFGILARKETDAVHRSTADAFLLLLSLSSWRELALRIGARSRGEATEAERCLQLLEMGSLTAWERVKKRGFFIFAAEPDLTGG